MAEKSANAVHRAVANQKMAAMQKLVQKGKMTRLQK